MSYTTDDPWPVAPFAGAWIEISMVKPCPGKAIVAPFAGAWIEIQKAFITQLNSIVAPFAGAWIEICCLWRDSSIRFSRSLRGGVD